MSNAAAVIELLSRDRQIRLLRRFEHGAGGTCLAQLDDRPVVIKGWPSSAATEQSVSGGLRWAHLMRSRGVPIPWLLERGTIAEYSYLVYEYVEGEWPTQVDHDLVHQMLGVIDRQRDAAARPDPRWRARLKTMITTGDDALDVTPRNLLGHPIGEEILRRAHHSWQLCDPAHIRSSDVVHGDFAPENLLVDRSRITAVVDWEQACVGDAGFDLAGIVYDVELGNKADPDTLRTLYAAITARVPPDTWQLFTSVYAVRYASWAINTEMESDVLETIESIGRRANR